MNENQQEGLKSTDPWKGQSDTSPINRSRSSQDGRPLQIIITEKAIHGAVPTEYALLKPSVWHSTQWQHEETLGAVRFSDGSTIFLQSQVPAGIRANQPSNNGNQKPAIGTAEQAAIDAMESAAGELGNDNT